MQQRRNNSMLKVRDKIVRELLIPSVSHEKGLDKSKDLNVLEISGCPRFVTIIVHFTILVASDFTYV